MQFSPTDALIGWSYTKFAGFTSFKIELPSYYLALSLTATRTDASSLVITETV
jgi:hypothetical protein